MKPYSIFPVALLAAPALAAAQPVEMSDHELSGVTGQAYIIELGPFQKPVADLTERDVVLVSDLARGVEAEAPLLTDVARQSAVKGVNLTVTATKTTVIAGVATVPGVGTVIAPILSLTPTPKVRFE